MNKIISATLIIIAFSCNASAFCCITEEAEVVAAGEAVVLALKQYNKEMDKSLDKSRSSVQAVMAQVIEKQRIVNEIYLLKKNSELRADAKSVLIQEILLKNQALLLNLSHEYSKNLNTEANELEEGTE